VSAERVDAAKPGSQKNIGSLRPSCGGRGERIRTGLRAQSDPNANDAPASSVCMSQCSFEQNRTPCNFEHSMTAETALQISTTAIAGKQRSETNHDSRQDRCKRGWFRDFTCVGTHNDRWRCFHHRRACRWPKHNMVKNAPCSGRGRDCHDWFSERCFPAIAVVLMLNELEFAELAFVAEHNKHAKNPNAEREVYDKAKDLYKKAQIKLGEAIEKQTNRLARDSSVYPRGRGLKNCGDVRQWGQQILDRTPSPHLKSHLEEAFRENRRLCAPRALIALSQAMAAKHKLNDAQAKEGRDIIADATDAVTGKREGDDDLTREEVTKNQLDRLENLLKTIETRMDGHQRFNAVLYNELINKLRGQIDQANNGRFDTLVKEFERLVNG
jgi:hypothetical protein